MLRIAIDPQGGGDSSIAGSLPQQVVGSNGLVDKDLLLAIALLVETILEARGLRVSMTRKSDRNISKAKRAQVARDASADIYVSIAFSGSDDPKQQGVLATVHKASDAASADLAEKLQAAMVSALGHPPLGVRRLERAGLRPDRLSDGTAACELKISFLSDPKEAKRLENSEYLDIISETIAEQLLQFASIESEPNDEAQDRSPQDDPGADHQLPRSNEDPTFDFRKEGNFKMATIIIDPGHGGTTNLPCSTANNAVGPVFNTLEKDLTLQVALLLDQELRDRGHTDVHLTRSTDTNLSGHDRARFAKRFSSDVLVSIHFNGSRHHNAQGTETFIHRRQSGTSDSAHLCRAVQAAVLRATGLRDRNALHPPHFVKTAGFCVLNPDNHGPDTAAVLTEISFLDRADEERRLLRPSYRDEIAFALAEGIEAYLGAGSNLSRNFAAEEVEDAFALAAIESGEEGSAFRSAGTDGQEEFGGYAIADPVPAQPSALAGARDIAQILSAPVMTSPADLDERSEGEKVHGSDAPDFSGFGQDADADAEVIGRLFGSNMAALTSFDHPAFADFVRGLNLRYFQPIELLYLGGQHNRPGDPCQGLNSLPPRSLWQRIAATIQMLDEIRHRLGGPVRITSAYRNDDYNACVNGKAGSLHKQFNAIDWTSTVGTVSLWHSTAKQVRDSDPKYLGGIGDYPAQNFVHVDTRGHSVDF